MKKRALDNATSKENGFINPMLKNVINIASSLSLQSYCAVDLIETKRQDLEYAQAMATYIIKIKGVSEDVASVIQHLFLDEALLQFNWEDGRENQQTNLYWLAKSYEVICTHIRGTTS